MVATPIGNLQDLSPRAQSILHHVDWIAAEDTRHSRHLLTHFGIKTPLKSLHEHNERAKSGALLHLLNDGNNIALISDAGTPLISDPGSYLIHKALAAKISVVPIPGPSALVSALSVAGIMANRFVFEGFLAPKTRRQHLNSIALETRTLIFYEAPHRIVACVDDMLQVFGPERTAVLCKELTKIFETVYQDSLLGISNWLNARAERQKGEFVLVVQGAPKPDNQILTPKTQQIFHILRQQLSVKQAAKLTSEITGVSKNILYDFGIQTKHEVEP